MNVNFLNIYSLLFPHIKTPPHLYNDYSETNVHIIITIVVWSKFEANYMLHGNMYLQLQHE
jgi:hypothetical protein